jgi:predicted nucleotidyltransferase
MIMDKRQIREKLLEAVKNDPHRNDIKQVAIFGSYVNGRATQASDIDVLVQFTEDAHIGFFEYVRIQRNLGDALGLKVDLVTPEALSKYIKPQVLQEAEVVYKR